MSTDFTDIFSSLNELLQKLADSKEEQDLKIPSKLNALVEQMREVETSVSREYSNVMIPIDVIETLDKSSSTYPIEEMLKNDFLEAESLNSELKDLKCRFKKLSENLFE